VFYLRSLARSGFILPSGHSIIDAINTTLFLLSRVAYFIKTINCSRCIVSRTLLDSKEGNACAVSPERFWRKAENDENSEISRLFSFGYESVEATLRMVSNTGVNSAEE